jgi:predicted O-methyltransferase YrrM
VLESARRIRQQVRFLAQLPVLPLRVALFQWRAWRLAARTGDEFALVSGTRPRNLAVLLRLAQGSRRVVELGTGSAWTTISLVLADQNCGVISYDPIERDAREQYLRLASPAVRRRLRFVTAPGSHGPEDGEGVDLLYIDSSHDRDETVREVQAWSASLKAGSLVVFDDFGHPGYPGVEEAVRVLGLHGQRRGAFYIHEVSR